MNTSKENQAPKTLESLLEKYDKLCNARKGDSGNTIREMKRLEREIAWAMEDIARNA